jgi:hypothetical protein
MSPRRLAPLNRPPEQGGCKFVSFIRFPTSYSSVSTKSSVYRHYPDIPTAMVFRSRCQHRLVGGDR